MYELQVEGMSCGHCVKAVTKAVQEIDSQAKINVDLANKKVQVDSSISLADIKAAIDDQGYRVTQAQAV